MGYECEVGLLTWEVGWSYGKKEWCCMFGSYVVRSRLHDTMGCPTTSGPPVQKLDIVGKYERERNEDARLTRSHSLQIFAQSFSLFLIVSFVALYVQRKVGMARTLAVQGVTAPDTALEL